MILSQLISTPSRSIARLFLKYVDTTGLALGSEALGVSWDNLRGVQKRRRQWQRMIRIEGKGKA